MATEALRGHVRMYQGKPAIHINDEPVPPILYSLTSVPSGRYSWEEIPAWNIRRFGEAGIHMHQVDFALQDVWLPSGDIDMTLALRQLQGVLDADPQACIMIRFHVNAPGWWDARHPEECTAYADVQARENKQETAFWSILNNNLWPLKLHSLASTLWREEATEAYQRFLCRLARTPQGARVFAIQVADGVYGEWHPFGFLEHDPDTSAPMQAAFRAFLREQYANEAALQAAWGHSVTFDSATVPDTLQREHTSDGVFRAAAKEQQVIDYYQCLHDVISSDILHFCRVTKEAWPRPVITAAFYGYYYSLFGRQAAGGHLGIEKVLASEWIDCLCAPQTYVSAHRAMGGSGQSRILLESARLHGKLTLDEMDQPPCDDQVHPIDKNLANHDEHESIAILRRNVFASAARGMGMWYYDFGPCNGSGWWMNPVFMREIQALQSLLTERFHRPYAPVADVLVVYDEKVFLRTANNPGADPVTDPIAVNQVSTALYRAGIAFDTVYLFDLPRVNLARYKAVVFANTYRMDSAQRSFIREKVAAGNRHLIWFYAPGALTPEGASAEEIQKVTGISLRRCRSVNPLQLCVDRVLPVGEIDLRMRYEDLYFMFPHLDIGLPKRVLPVFAVDDPQAEPIAHYAHSSDVAIARKQHEGWTSWYCGMPLADADALNAIFRQAGAHIYCDSRDTLLVGAGLLLLHTKHGGNRTIRLSNDREVTCCVPPASSTFFDLETGETILP